jgi:hypothetical protein
MFIGITVYVKPYNDKRAYIYQLTSLSCSLWGIFISSVFISFGAVEAWVSLELGGFFIILCVGILQVIRSDSIIYSEKAVNISDLFLRYIKS